MSMDTDASSEADSPASAGNEAAPVAGDFRDPDWSKLGLLVAFAALILAIVALIVGQDSKAAVVSDRAVVTDMTEPAADKRGGSDNVQIVVVGDGRGYGPERCFEDLYSYDDYVCYEDPVYPEYGYEEFPGYEEYDYLDDMTWEDEYHEDAEARYDREEQMFLDLLDPSFCDTYSIEELDRATGFDHYPLMAEIPPVTHGGERLTFGDERTRFSLFEAVAGAVPIRIAMVEALDSRMIAAMYAPTMQSGLAASTCEPRNVAYWEGLRPDWEAAEEAEN